MISKEQLQDLRGGDLFGAGNEKIGSISDIYLDDQTGQPAWATVNTGMFSGDSFVPLDDATIADGGLAVPYTKDKVKDAPQIEAGQHLDAEHEVELYRYYGVQFDGDTTRTDATEFQGDRVDAAQVEGDNRGDFGRWDGGDTAAAGVGAAGAAGAAGYAGRDNDAKADYDRQYGDDTALETERDRAGFFGGRDDRGADATTAVPTAAASTGYATEERTTDYDRTRTADYDRAGAVDGERTSVTRHEERLNVGKERRETGAVRLKKYVVEEDETITVPLERESVEIERREITDAQSIGAWDFADDELEITLVEEHPVISKEVYAVEEIGLNKKVVTENRQVTERVRRERVEIEGIDEDTRDNGGLFGRDKDRNDRI